MLQYVKLKHNFALKHNHARIILYSFRTSHCLNFMQYTIQYHVVLYVVFFELSVLILYNAFFGVFFSKI